jgi:hypothetical protein
MVGAVGVLRHQLEPIFPQLRWRERLRAALSVAGEADSARVAGDELAETSEVYSRLTCPLTFSGTISARQQLAERRFASRNVYTPLRAQW